MMQGHRRTKIVVTWGPAIAAEATMRAVLRAGVDVVRLNFSHGTHAEFRDAAPLIRRLAEEEGRAVALLGDIQGPRLRTGHLTGGGPVTLEEGATVTIASEDVPGTAQRFAIVYPRLSADVRVGQRILIADGALVLQVQEVSAGGVLARVVVGGPLGEHKGVNLPDAAVSAGPLTAKDQRDLALAVELGMDYVALSFVRRGTDVEACRRALVAAGRATPVIAKIEHPQAVAALDEVLGASDAVMVARGDLGVEVSPQRVPVLQKRIIRAANERGIAVITATQMLESMVNTPNPTRAEASDVANAILDGSDAVMLSAETAIGRYPVEAVRMMGLVAGEAEQMMGAPHPPDASDQAHAIAGAACALADHVKAKALLVFTQSGRTARAVSQYRSPLPIYAVTPNLTAYRALALWFGVTPLLTGLPEDVETAVDQGLALLAGRGLVARGDRVVVVGSSPLMVRGLTNLVLVRTVGGEVASSV